jgi:urease beta subunit
MENHTGGLADLQADVTWIFGGGNPSSILNRGTFRKSAGTGTSTFQDLPFDNEGTLAVHSGSLTIHSAPLHNTAEVQVNAGELILTGGGSSSGQIITTSGTAVVFEAGSMRLLEEAQFGGAGWCRIRGATVLCEGDVAVPQLELTSGQVDGPGALTVTEAFVWNGSSMMQGAGSTIVGPNASATLSGAGDRNLSGRTLINQGTLAHTSPCRLVFYSAARMENHTGGLADLQADVTWIFGGGSPSSLLNRGTFLKSAGTGTSVIQGLPFDNEGTLAVHGGSLTIHSAPFHNTAEVQVNAGELILTGGGSSSGQIITTSGTAVVFEAGSMRLLEEAQFGGAGWCRIRGAALHCEGDVAVPQLELTSGQVDGPGALTVTEAFVWNGSSMMQGAGSTIVGPNASATLSGAGDRNLSGRTLINQGTLAHTSPCRLVFHSAARMENHTGGTVDLQADVTWIFGGGSPSSLLNRGTFLKSAGTGTSVIQGLPFDNEGTLAVHGGSLTVHTAPFHNTAEVQVNAGELILTGGGSSSGQIITTSGTAVVFEAGSMRLLEEAQFEGAGWCRIRGATVLCEGDVAVPQLELTSGQVDGPGALTVTEAFVWNGSSMMQGAGSTIVGPNASATLSGAGDRNLSGRTLINQGNLAHTSPCRLVFYSAARMENHTGGLADLQADVTWIFGGGSPSSLLNRGTFLKSAGTGTSVIQGLPFDNEGTLAVHGGSLTVHTAPFHNTAEVQVNAGELILTGGGSSSGQIITTSGTAVVFEAGSMRLLEEAQFGGAGWCRIRGAALHCEGDVAVPQLELTSGQVDGPGALTVTEAFVWNGSSMMQGAGSTIVGPNASATLSGTGDRNLSGRTLINQGTLAHTSPCRLVFYSAARMENHTGGLADLQADVTWIFGGGNPSSILNRGTFRKSAGTGTSVIQGLPFDNEGTLAVRQGILHFPTAPDLGPTTTVEFDLGGTAHPNDYGRIMCGQTLRLAGRLAVAFRDGFVPGPGQQFDVLTVPVQGVFGSYSAPPISPSVFINPVYRTDGVSLVTTDPTPIVWNTPGIDPERPFQLNIQGVANLSYVVLASTDFEAWTALSTNAAPASTIWNFIDVDSAVIPFRFYQVVYQP